MKGFAIPLLFALSVGPALAEAITYTASDGVEYAATPNAHGVVLEPRDAGGAGKLYLGKACDAFSEDYGKGTWGWANGGFGADFPDFEIRFPRQEVQWTDSLDCRW
ncbi:MAG: hypothetical protein KDJ77_05580 [Rhodobiaceae bacterium]|nr:hypothetical protein [Rhodobiaceae bacterium]